jgi:hypothetical protein
MASVMRIGFIFIGLYFCWDHHPAVIPDESLTPT